MKHRLALTVSLILLSVSASDPELAERQRAMHALNRLTFGARPGEVDRVLKIGVDRWIEQQLHPETIADRELDARLQSLPTLGLPGATIIQNYYRPLLQARRELKKNRDGEPAEPEDGARMRTLRRNAQQVMSDLVSQRIIRASLSDRQLNEVMVDFWFNHFNVFAGKGIDRFMLTAYERDVIRPHLWGRFEDLLLATAKSPAMLFYLDNARSTADPVRRPAWTRAGASADFQRRALRRFPGPMPTPGREEIAPPKTVRGGVNENYAREIMELHTLGVDGGYTQKDVTELARVLTGWTIAPPQAGGGFLFRKRLHDVGAKTVLGTRFPPGGGIEEGEKMIRLLAHHPATARHIAYQLVQRLVSDDPPGALVNRVARRFLESDGDLRQTVKTVIDSPEFWSPRSYHAKVKAPFQYAISTVRALDAQMDDPTTIARELQRMGEPLYGAQPPTGYSDRAEAWINTGALLNRLNFALAIAANKIPGVHSDVMTLIPASAAGDVRASVDALAQILTGGDLTEATRSIIRSRVVERNSSDSDPGDDTQIPMIAGLILGSPEFQRQ